MTDNEINIAIAEVCGILGPWKEKITPCGCDGQWDFFNQNGNRLPDYCQDLDRIHSAEKIELLSANANDYEYWLLKLSDGCAWHATARQRAEAFLRTLGRWND